VGDTPRETHYQFIENFLSKLKAQSTILEAGYSAGVYAAMLLEPKHSMLGIDQSSGMLARARRFTRRIVSQASVIKKGLAGDEFPWTVRLGNLRRFGTALVSPLVVMTAQVFVVFIMTCLGMLRPVTAVKLVYHVQFPGNILSI
jgi:hypothetical protein